MNLNQDYYNNICEKWYEFRKKTKINNCILHFIQKLNPNSHILDVGCGTGYPIDYYLANNWI